LGDNCPLLEIPLEAILDGGEGEPFDDLAHGLLGSILVGDPCKAERAPFG